MGHVDCAPCSSRCKQHYRVLAYTGAAIVADASADRLAKVRRRFVSSIESKLEDTYEALPSLIGGASAAPALATTYRRIHDICGVADTVGFSGTGRAARKLDMILVVPHQEQRGLTASEMTPALQALHALREASLLDLQSVYTSWR